MNAKTLIKKSFTYKLLKATQKTIKDKHKYGILRIIALDMIKLKIYPFKKHLIYFVTKNGFW